LTLPCSKTEKLKGFKVLKVRIIAIEKFRLILREGFEDDANENDDSPSNLTDFLEKYESTDLPIVLDKRKNLFDACNIR